MSLIWPPVLQQPGSGSITRWPRNSKEQQVLCKPLWVSHLLLSRASDKAVPRVRLGRTTKGMHVAISTVYQRLEGF